MMHDIKIVQKCGRERLAGFRRLEWAWQSIFWQMYRHLHN